jgi:hypothetical protein
MSAKGNEPMERPLGEDDLKALEEEIDFAVDRLFVEEKEGAADGLSMAPSLSEPSLRIEKPVEIVSPLYSIEEKVVLEPSPGEKPSASEPDLESPALPSFGETAEFSSAKEPLPPSMALSSHDEEPPRDEERQIFPGEPPAYDTVPASVPWERLETHLQSFKWGITKERIEETKEMVIHLQDQWKHEPEMTSISNRMGMALDFMVKGESTLQTPLVKFLTDAKDTLKLLMRREPEQELTLYKQLACQGIEARFLCLKQEVEAQRKPVPFEAPEGPSRAPLTPIRWERIEEIAEKITLFSSTMKGALERIDQRLAGLEKGIPTSSTPAVVHRPAAAPITVFKVDGKFFGVQSDHILKLFKVPVPLRDKVVNQQRIRLKDLDVKLVDLKKIFSLQTGDSEREVRILIVSDDEQYKGLLIEEVLQRLSNPSDLGKGSGHYFIGSIPWTYQERPVEIEVLDVRKL